MGISFWTSLNNPLFRNIPHGGFFWQFVICCICVFVCLCICVFVFFFFSSYPLNWYVYKHCIQCFIRVTAIFCVCICHFIYLFWICCCVLLMLNWYVQCAKESDRHLLCLRLSLSLSFCLSLVTMLVLHVLLLNCYVCY